MSKSVVLETQLESVPVRRGKVRDIYDLGDALLLVATDRISAFDWVLPTGIPDKGRVLTQVSAFWFDELKVAGDAISSDKTRVFGPIACAQHTLHFNGKHHVLKLTAQLMPVAESEPKHAELQIKQGDAWKTIA
ncbi:MAG: hypothetical protein MI757_13830, partial [Pirellulales bacterium]|nr:hypothetical protein [Pirellulales bacterium]